MYASVTDQWLTCALDLVLKDPHLTVTYFGERTE